MIRLILISLLIIITSLSLDAQNNSDKKYKKILRDRFCAIAYDNTIDYDLLKSKTWTSFFVKRKKKYRIIDERNLGGKITFGKDYVETIIDGRIEKTPATYEENRIIVIPSEEEKMIFSICEFAEDYLKVKVYIRKGSEFKFVYKVIFVAK